MNLRIILTLIAFALSCVFTVSVPLISMADKEAVSDVTDVFLNDEITRPNSEQASTEEITTPPEQSVPPAITESTESTGSSDVDKKDTTIGVFLHSENKVVEMTLEEYIVCVVAAEMPYTFSSEALKAQAVAARTYCIYKPNEGNTHRNGADVCTDYAHCAAFITEAELTAKYGKKVTESIITKISNAVKATEGQILTYGGKPILAVFHSRSYLYTESSENIWGGYLPYLVSVSTPEEDSVSVVNITSAKLDEIFMSDSAVSVSTSTANNVLSSQKNDSGRVDTLILYGKEIKAKLMRSVFGFRSTNFEYQKTDDGWSFTVHGYGHGVGMSQYGANEMAKNGSKYDQILLHYYQGAKIEKLT